MKQKNITKEYKKQLNRINKYINKWYSEGKIISFKEKPLIKPTVKSVERLKRMTAKELSKKARYVDIEAGTLISESLWKERRREQLKEERKKKKGDGYIPVENVYQVVKRLIESINDYRTLVTRSGGVIHKDNGPLINMLIGFLDDLYAEYGDTVDMYLMSVQDELATLINQVNVAYYYEDFAPTVTSLANVLKRAPLTQEESNIVSENNEGLGVWG